MKGIELFPGTLTRSKGHGTPFVLTDEQERWFTRWYPISADKDLAKAMGCGYMSVRRMAKKLGIEKDRRMISERYCKIVKTIVESERRRDRWGLPRRTSLHLPFKKYSASQIARRYKAVHKYNYILADDCSDEGGHRYCIYYDENTNRNEHFEYNSRRAGFEIKRWTE